MKCPSIFVKGDGEIIEEIVSASRQKEINKAATMGDGNSFQASISSVLNNKWYLFLHFVIKEINFDTVEFFCFGILTNH